MAISKRQEKTHNQAKINGNDVFRRSLQPSKASTKNKQARILLQRQQRHLPPTPLIKKLITQHPPIITPPLITNKPNKLPILPKHNKKETPKNLPYPSITQTKQTNAQFRHNKHK